jgi:UDP-N-acetyl-D-galactosamine dehydrogenase
MSSFENFAAVITAWPSRRDFESDLGLRGGLAAVWKHRDSIPARSWAGVIEAAKRRGISGVSYDLLARLAATKRAPRHADGGLRIAVIGLGYVGLPLAVALARHFRVTGFDIDRAHIAALGKGRDRAAAVPKRALATSGVELTAEGAALSGADIFIITVPTPVDANNRPDLRAVRAAARTVGRHIAAGATVVLESTVYPGVTEEVCGPIIARASGLKCGRNFFLGYAPERMNPGDSLHTVDRITKVVAGQTPAVADRLAAVYGAVTGGNVFVARDIKSAEAAKAIENAQRDINIAFINEVAMICDRLGLSVYEVLDAARTKWNFLDFTPGLVGGHCVSVDPFYLAHRAEKAGHTPEVILAGRRINDSMAGFVAARIAARLPAATRVLVLGLTFKADVPDLRNSKVADLIAGLAAHGHTIEVHDPIANPDEAVASYGVRLLPSLRGLRRYGCVVGAVAHKRYRELAGPEIAALAGRRGLIADLAGMWRHTALPHGLRRWQL